MPPTRTPESGPNLPRTVGFLAAAGVMVGVTIGSGIYRTPSEIARHVDHPWQMVAAWVVGGLLSLFGALTYAEMAAAMPRSGGLYAFLHEGLGPRVSFIFGWTYMLITKPLAAAGIAVVFAEYLAALLGPGYVPWLNANLPGAASFHALLGDSWHTVLLVCLTLSLLTFINSLGMRLGSGVNLALTIIKVLCLLSIVACAGLAAAGLLGQASTIAPPVLATTSPTTLLALAPVLSAVLWTYDGWADVGSIAGEVKDPQRNLPRIFIAGTLGLMAMYLAVNLAYLSALGLEEMRTSTAVAGDAMQRLVGPWGATAVVLFVLLSTLGSTHASIMTGARVTFAQARDGLLFRGLGAIHPVRQTPHVALWTQLTLSCLCTIFFQQFENLAGGFVFTMWIFYGLGGVAMLRLRRTRPDLERPYRCIGHPVIPLAFIAAAAGMTILQVHDTLGAPVEPGELPPWARLAIFGGILVLGWPAYDLWRRWTGPHSPDR